MITQRTPSQRIRTDRPLLLLQTLHHGEIDLDLQVVIGIEEEGGALIMGDEVVLQAHPRTKVGGDRTEARDPNILPRKIQKGKDAALNGFPIQTSTRGRILRFTTFPIPLNSTISIRSFLSQATGTLRVSLDEGLHDTGSIQVIANGVTQKNLNQIGACLVTNKGRYFNTLSLKPKGFAAEVATYSIHLRFPSREASYPGLITDLPGFAQSFDDLSIARFDFIEAGGMDGSIDALSILAKFIIVRSYNGTVDGHFSAEKGLTIHGEFSPITITSNICDDGWAFPTFARISTYQSPIDARLTLCNHTTAMEDESYGRYLVDVSNSDSPIALQIEHTYPAQGSSLYVNVTNIERERTGASHVMVTLDTGFEGNFELRADGDKALPPSVKSEEATDDHGGVRNVEINRVENEQRLIGGKVYWDSPVPPLDRRGSGVRINTFGSGEASLTLLGD
ncbi:hypothetical protein M408DRAFT_253842 [Serendipita vermifera MAFF 305830]|uniref:Uncharacterized protein n=1 Tax=Serendipita vermifera MAFF 305830 TaxID=933852 RepID=A0A0C3BG57_SERVB|nr:hypothetical protein M408DRAFT_253842 [Serendipita vermifera MAFF 305830]